MRKNVLRYAPVALALLTAALTGCATDPDSEPTSTEKVTSDGTRIVRAEAGRLTAPSVETPDIIARDFIGARAAVTSADELAVTSRATSSTGITHVRMTQTVDGLRVHGAYAKIAVSEDGEVIQAVERLGQSNGKIARPAVTEEDALSAAMKDLGYGRIPDPVESRDNVTSFERTEELYRRPTVELVAYIADDGTLQSGFLVETWSLVGNHLHHTLVDGAGAIVSSEDRTANDSYNVFAEDPLKGSQGVVSGPGAGNAQSPSGWLGTGTQTTVNISGNNVKAYLDTDANNAADSGGTTVTTGNFVTAVDLTQAPSIAANKAVAVQNLFYHNNVIHDRLYTHGFNEANGNFQVNNFGKGGAGNDAVNAEAQDGSGTDNANFATPGDGSAPRMQMYLWTGNTPGGLVGVGSSTYGAFPSAFGTALTATGVTGALAVYNDNSGVSPSDGCELSAVALTGKVAIIDRGTCDFTVKVLNAQKAGAIGAVIVNNVSPGAFAPGGTNKQIKIPSGMVTQADGAILKSLAGQSSNLRKNPAPNLQIDGDIDADVIYHEYGHGLTWRMIGSMSGKLAGAIGEGASDTTAFLINGDDRIGEYAYSNPVGIRRFPYQGYPNTYSDVAGASVHDDGEIYAGAMWRLLQSYLAAGYTSETLLHDFVDGMNYTPAAPAFEDMRDGMLQSVAGTGRECLIWSAFAASGIGVGADGRVAQSGALTIVESFAVPASCP